MSYLSVLLPRYTSLVFEGWVWSGWGILHLHPHLQSKVITCPEGQCGKPKSLLLEIWCNHLELKLTTECPQFLQTLNSKRFIFKTHPLFHYYVSSFLIHNLRRQLCLYSIGGHLQVFKLSIYFLIIKTILTPQSDSLPPPIIFLSFH